MSIRIYQICKKNWFSFLNHSLVDPLKGDPSNSKNGHREEQECRMIEETFTWGRLQFILWDRYSRTVVMPTRHPSSTSCRWILLPVMHCLRLILGPHSFNISSIQDTTTSKTGFRQGFPSPRTGSLTCRYLRTVLRLTLICRVNSLIGIPSKSTLCLITCTWSILNSLFSGSLWVGTIKPPDLVLRVGQF